MNVQAASAVTWSMTAQGSRPMRGERRCACGKPFIPNHGHQLFCSVECVGNIKKTCRVCRKPFRTYKADQVFCSKACKHEGSRVLHRLCCVVCDAEFESKDKRKRTCSRACHDRLRTETKNYGGLQSSRVFEVLEHAPEDQAGAMSFLNTVPFQQLDASWVPLLTEMFCEGRRRALSECLRSVRKRYRRELERYRSRSGTREAV